MSHNDETASVTSPKVEKKFNGPHRDVKDMMEKKRLTLLTFPSN